MSRLDDLVTAIAAQYNDGTVLFEAGRLRLNEHAQQRRITFVREQGGLTFTSNPGAQPFGAPVSGVGTFTRQRFARDEVLAITLRAEDESTLDDMFDRLVNAIFEVCGPNAFEGRNAYQWAGQDSDQGGRWERRNPQITIWIRFRLASRSQPITYVQVAAATADVEELGETTTVISPAP